MVASGETHTGTRNDCQWCRVGGGESRTYRQVWAVTYDSDTPMMDGSHPPIRMADQPLEWAQRNYDLMVTRSARSPKRNLRIETRFVSDYEPLGGDGRG